MTDPGPRGPGLEARPEPRLVEPVVGEHDAHPAPETLATTKAAMAKVRRRRRAARGRATYEVRRLDLWSVLKLSLVFYLCMFLVVLVAGVGLWAIAAAAGVIGNFEQFMGELLGAKDFHFLGARILAATVLGGLVLVAIASGLTVLAAVFYNLIAELVGGFEVTVIVDDAPPGPRV